MNKRKYFTPEEVKEAHRKVAREAWRRRNDEMKSLGWKSSQAYFELLLEDKQVIELLQSQGIPANVILALSAKGKFKIRIKVARNSPTNVKPIQKWEDNFEAPVVLDSK